MRRFGFPLLFLSVTLASCGEGEKANWTTTPSGVKYEDLVVGDGAEAKKGDTVKVHYTGWLASNKKKFDSSIGKDPLEFTIGTRGIIAGWNEGVPGMKVGGKRKLHIPSRLAYAKRGFSPEIPPDADLVFEVELLAIEK